MPLTSSYSGRPENPGSVGHTSQRVRLLVGKPSIGITSIPPMSGRCFTRTLLMFPVWNSGASFTWTPGSRAVPHYPLSQRVLRFARTREGHGADQTPSAFRQLIWAETQHWFDMS